MNDEMTIRRLYASGKTLKEVSDITGASIEKIRETIPREEKRVPGQRFGQVSKRTKEILKEAKNTKNLSEVARKFNTSRQYIHKIVNKYGDLR